MLRQALLNLSVNCRAFISFTKINYNKDVILNQFRRIKQHGGIKRFSPPGRYRMNATHILIDDSNPLHRELPIYRTGKVGTVRLADKDYKVYSSIEISAHDYAALFHYRVVEALNELTFISESKNGLDSWDEAFLPSGNIAGMMRIIRECLRHISGTEPERILLGWQDDPERIGYWRVIDPLRTVEFLGRLSDFAAAAASDGYDLEFIL